MQRRDDTAPGTLPANAAVALTAVPLDDAVARLRALITGESLAALTRDDTPPPLALNWPTTFRVERRGMASILLWHGAWLAVAEESGYLDKLTRVLLITPAGDSPHERLRAAFPDAQFWETEHRCYDAVTRKPPQPREPIRLRRGADTGRVIALLTRWLKLRPKAQPVVTYDGTRLTWHEDTHSGALWSDDETVWVRSRQCVTVSLDTSAPTKWPARLTGGTPLLTVEREDVPVLTLVNDGANPRIDVALPDSDVAALRRLLFERKLLRAGRPPLADKWRGDAAAFWNAYQAAVEQLQRQREPVTDAEIAKKLEVHPTTLANAMKRYIDSAPAQLPPRQRRKEHRAKRR